MYDYRYIIDKLQNSKQHKSIGLDIDKWSYECLNHCFLCKPAEAYPEGYKQLHNY